MNTKVPSVSAEKIESFIRSIRVRRGPYSAPGRLYEDNIKPLAKRIADSGKFGLDVTEDQINSEVVRLTLEYKTLARSVSMQNVALRKTGLEKLKPEYQDIDRTALRHLTAQELLEFANSGTLPSRFSPKKKGTSDA